MISWRKRSAGSPFAMDASSQLIFQESALSAQEKVMVDMRDEIGYLKERETSLSKVSPSELTYHSVLARADCH